MMQGHKDFLRALNSAKKEISIIGVVPFEVKWAGLARSLLQQLREQQELEIKLLCESDNNLFTKALTYDIDSAGARRKSYQDMRFDRDQAIKIIDNLRDAGAEIDELARVHVEIMHLPIPIAAALIDGKLYASLWLHEYSDIERINKDHPWSELIGTYVEKYLKDERITNFAAAPGAELLELFDHSQIPRGIFPRSSFYDTIYSQLVVWALVFDRKGRLLIHRRSSNAKDNKGMWDKSVGGHVDYVKDHDNAKAIARELIEELFTDEMREQDLTTWDITDRDMIYLGEWRPDQRKQYPFEEIKRIQKEWVYLKLKDRQSLSSPRILEQGKKKLNVIADVFLFVANPKVNDKSVKRLKNSDFKLIEPNALKTVIDRSHLNQETPDFDMEFEIPRFSPDLLSIMDRQLKDTLDEFSNFIKTYIME